MKTKLLFLVMLLIMFGCAPRMVILLDGVPVSDRMYTLTNPHTGLTIDVVAARWHFIDETGEKVLQPEYFGVGKKFYVDPNDTEFVEVLIKVKNPNKVRYQLSSITASKEIVGVGPKESGVHTMILYEGRLRHYRTNVRHSVKGNMCYVNRIRIKDKSGMTIMSIGRFTFIGREATFAEGGDAG